MLTPKKREFLPILILSLVFPAFLLAMRLCLHADTVDVTGSLVRQAADGPLTVYELPLAAPAEGQRYELMLQSTGNIIEVRSGEALLYEYGSELADSGRMVGSVFVHAFLPASAYDQPLRISLRAVDSNASPTLRRVELCPHQEVAKYYMTNKNLGFPLALVLLSMAFCIPVFLLLGDGLPLMQEGLLFGCILLCFSVLLLGPGGHYLLFSSDQYAWNAAIYLARYLFPILFLLYFRALESAAPYRKLLSWGAGVNMAGFGAASVLALANAVHFCDLQPLYYTLLVLDGALGVYLLFRISSVKRRSTVKRMLLNVSVVWTLFVAFYGILTMYILPQRDWPPIDTLSVCAVIIFYILCGLLAESALHLRRDARAKDLRIQTLEASEQAALSMETLALTLSEGYESIYLIDAETGAYTCYYESSAHGELGVAAEGESFFDVLTQKAPHLFHPDDLSFASYMLGRDAMRKRTEDGRHHSIYYRILTENGTPVYHQATAVQREMGGREQILLGIHDIDAMMRREQAYVEKQESMRQKEFNHLEAILASSAGYLEVNLTQDLILEYSPSPAMERYQRQQASGAPLVFSAFIQWWAAHMVAEHAEKFLSINNRELMIRSFASGDRRVSGDFAFHGEDGHIQPCRQIAYLYRDRTTDDVMCFHVIYDLTEQQRQEKELQELERELHLSRIRTFTGQMQPHFLYNALASIQEIVLDDPAYASELIGDFTIHLRGSIRAMSNDDPITFRQELENIRAYTNIEKMRFGEKLRIDYAIHALDFPILPLSIQPLVENAIRHGIYQRGPQGGTVTVQSDETAEAWIVQVRDDGVGFDVNALYAPNENGGHMATGLKNLIFRLDKVMHAKVDIESVIGAGTCVTVTVPKGGAAE